MTWMYLISMLIGLSFLACEKKSQGMGRPESIRPESNKLKKVEADLSKFKGVWVDTQSFNSFRNSASPADLRSTHPVDLTIADTSTLTWGYHEGINLVTDRISGDTLYLTCLENPKDMSLSLGIIDDTTLICRNCIRDTSVILKKFSTIRPESSGNCSCYGLPCYFSQKYFTGEFRISGIDTVVADSEVRFPNSCEIQGFKEFDAFNISFDDYMSFTNLDVIEFVKTNDSAYTESDFAYFHFKLARDSIYLYDFDPPYDSIARDTANEIDDAKIGKLKFVLSRT